MNGPLLSQFNIIYNAFDYGTQTEDYTRSGRTSMCFLFAFVIKTKFIMKPVVSVSVETGKKPTPEQKLHNIKNLHENNSSEKLSKQQ